MVSLKRKVGYGLYFQRCNHQKISFKVALYRKKINSNLTSAYCSYSLDYHSRCLKRSVHHFMTYEIKSDKLTC